MKAGEAGGVARDAKPERQALARGVPDDALIAAYRATDYRVDADPPFVLHVGRHSAELDRLMHLQGVDCAACVTAWNPGSVPAPRDENRAAQERLECGLRAAGHTLITGEGRDPAGHWPAEASVLVLGLSRAAAVDIGRACRQHAVLWARRGAAVELVLMAAESA
jgi:hypothetical protein